MRYLLIGGGGIVVAFLFLRGKGGGEDRGQNSDTVTYGGGTLAPNAALALGSLETQLMQQSGIIQDHADDLFDSLHSQLDTQASALSDVGSYQHGMQQSILGLYREQLANGRPMGTPEEISDWSAWLRGKFPAYALGDLPPGYFGEWDPVQPE